MERIVSLSKLPACADRELVARCVAGDRAAQRRLFEQEKRQVHATLFRILGPSQYVDDVLQDVFISVFRGLHTFRGEASLSTWIDRCTVRAAFAHIRSRRSRIDLELVPDVLPGEAPSAERRALAREATRRLFATLDRLEPKHRQAFTLHAIDGCSVSEVAGMMDATVVATKARVWRARRYVERRAKVDPTLAEYVGE